MATHAKEIAAKLGLSAAAVSLALRGRPGVSEQTRALVLQTAAAMGYAKNTPSPAAAVHRSLQLVLYKKHGMVVGETTFFAQLSQSIAAEAKRHGYDLMLTYFYEEQSTAEQLHTLQASGCSGILLLATEMHTADLQPFAALNIPFVVLDSYFPTQSADCILINNVYGAKHAVQYLLTQGHTEIGYLSSDVTIRNFHERHDGYLRGIKTIPVINNSRRHILKVTPTPDGAYADMLAHLATGRALPTAFFADNDLIAIACMRALRKAGYHVPDDISVIGFDGISTGEMTDPPLTTMNVPQQQLGMAAVQRLLERIDGRTCGTVKIEVATQLVVRGSVKNISK